MFKTKYHINADNLALRRFNEIEMFITFEELSSSLGVNHARKFLGEMLQIPYEHKDIFNQMFIRTKYPTKKELVIYYRYHQVPYDTIRKIYGISPITIKKYIDQYQQGEFQIMPREPALALNMMPFLKKSLKEIAKKLADTENKLE